MEEELEIEHTKLGVPLRETRKGKNDIFFCPVLERNKSAAKLVEIVRHFIHCWKATGSAGKGPSAPLLSSSLRFIAQNAQLAEVPVGAAQDDGSQSSRESRVGKYCVGKTEPVQSFGWLAGFTDGAFSGHIKR